MNLIYVCFLFIINFYYLKEDNELSPLAMENGKVINNCNDYILMRKNFKLQEDLNNMISASEYLICSYYFSIGKVEKKDNIIENFYNKFEVSKLPLSIKQSIKEKTTFRELNWILEKEYNQIKFENEYSNIVIKIENKTINGYLVFIIDESLDGAYRAYYPAELIECNDFFEITPIYKSGW